MTLTIRQIRRLLYQTNKYTTFNRVNRDNQKSLDFFFVMEDQEQKFEVKYNGHVLIITDIDDEEPEETHEDFMDSICPNLKRQINGR